MHTAYLPRAKNSKVLSILYVLLLSWDTGMIHLAAKPTVQVQNNFNKMLTKATRCHYLLKSFTKRIAIFIVYLYGGCDMRYLTNKWLYSLMSFIALFVPLCCHAAELPHIQSLPELELTKTNIVNSSI